MFPAMRTVLGPVRNLIVESADVPRNLDSVTQSAAEDEVPPESAGMTPDSVSAIWRAVLNMYATGMHPGVSLTLRRHGKVVIKRAIGHARGNGPGDHDRQPVLMTPETPVCLFSASKALAAMAVHLLSERKQISLLDPVSHYVPAFGQSGKKDITIYQLLCHKAGIPTIDVEGRDAAELLLDPKEILRLLYASAPERPGHHYAYHALTAGFVVADLVEKVSGQTFRAFFSENITRKMGLKVLDFGARGVVLRKVARHYVTGFRLAAPLDLYLKRAIGTTLKRAVDVSNDPRFYKAVIPAGNAVATADECSRFFQCLLDGGVIDGSRVFQPLTVRRAVAEVGKPEFDRSLLLPLRYSAGMMLGDSPFGLYGPHSAKAFGHLGFTNNFLWADPERDISVALLTTGKLALGLHAPWLLNLLYRISKHCPRLTEDQQQERLASSGMC
jgi:CubicO group peptidase (beta-lactamase class C family)